MKFDFHFTASSSQKFIDEAMELQTRTFGNIYLENSKIDHLTIYFIIVNEQIESFFRNSPSIKYFAKERRLGLTIYLTENNDQKKEDMSLASEKKLILKQMKDLFELVKIKYPKIYTDNFEKVINFFEYHFDD